MGLTIFYIVGHGCTYTSLTDASRLTVCLEGGREFCLERPVPRRSRVKADRSI